MFSFPFPHISQFFFKTTAPERLANERMGLMKMRDGNHPYVEQEYFLVIQDHCPLGSAPP
jgi:hypothetical protein